MAQMLFREIADTSAAVTRASARREKIAQLANLLERLGGDEVRTAVAFLCGSTRRGRIGVGWAALRDAPSGAAARTAELTLLEVDRALEGLAGESGTGSGARRAAALAALLARCTDAEQDFLKRLLIGELRQGALEAVLVEGIAKAAGLPAKAVRRAVMLSGDPGGVAEIALTQGADGVDRIRIAVGRPVQPMLAQGAGDLEGALAKLGRAAFEWKLDGVRVQLHRRESEVRVFTRRLNDVTEAVPELVEAALRLPVREVVLDGEALALRADGRPHSFQTTMRRFGRRLDVARLRAELPLSPFWFDCLHCDGEAWIDRPAARRRSDLAALLEPRQLVPAIVTGDLGEAEAFLAQALDRGHEGVMAKALDAPYEAGRRGAGWLKVKPTHTLDLVVLAAEWGSGRRRGWLSNLHLGARDEAGDFVMLGKTFKGLTDELLAWQTERLQQLERARERHVVHVEPRLVVEIAFDGVQASPHYPAGLALRFARVKRYREDKTPTEADTIRTVREIFDAQTR